MNKLFHISTTVLFLLSSCSTDDTIQEPNPESGKFPVSFYGRTSPETRMQIGDKTDNIYPVLWTLGDQIGIISPSSELFTNASATLNRSDAGKNSGIFVLDETVAIKEKTDLIVYYPYNEVTTFKRDMVANKDVLTSYIPMEQKQPRPNDSSYTGKYTLAYAETEIDPATAVGEWSPSASFALKHAAAYVKLVISSSEYASYKLCGASLWCDGEAISGDLSVTLATGEHSTTIPRNYATVTVEEPQPLSSAQELWLVTLPVDLTGKDAYVSVSMTDGTKNVTIPVKVVLKQLKANAVNTITLTNVSRSDNPFAWYQPEETRFLAEGWTYGESNTFVTTAAGQEISIDVKARGYFNGCEEPKYAKIIFTSNVFSADRALAVNGTTEPDVEVAVASDYTLNIKAVSNGSSPNGIHAGWLGKVALLNADKECIWAFSIWHIPGGFAEHAYKTAVVMDRYIGDSFPNDYENWHGMGVYFQWGRPFCFTWDSEFSKGYSSGVTDLRISAKNPDKRYTTSGVTKQKGDWWLGDWTPERTPVRSDRKDDFWGNPNTSTENGSPEKGIKSIFDPCPKGWMVASPSVFKEVLAGKEAEFEMNGSVRSLIYKYDGTNKAYWHFSGAKWASSGQSSNCLDYLMNVWSNSSYGDANFIKAYQFYYQYNKPGVWTDNANRATTMSVRCMKDTENR